MTDLTRRQRHDLDRHRRLLLDIADVLTALAGSQGAIVVAHSAAATLTTGDSPASSWAGDSGHGSVGSHSDPTAAAVLSDERTGADLATLGRYLTEFAEAGYRAHDLARRIASRLNRGDGTQQQRQDDELHDANVGRGACDVCGRWCEGQGHDRRTTLRQDDQHGHRTPLHACGACRKDWGRSIERGDYGTDEVYAWCDDRRRHVERSA